MRARSFLAVAATGLVGLAAACLPVDGASVSSTGGFVSADGFIYACVDGRGHPTIIDPGTADQADACRADEHEVRWTGEAFRPPGTTTTEPTTSSTAPPTTEPPTEPPTTEAPTTTTTQPPAPGAFPTAATTGADETVPLTVIDHDVTVTTPGALVENERFTNYANLWINAPNVLVKNVVFEGGRLNNDVNGTIGTGMDVEHVTFTNVPGTAHNMNPDVHEAVTYRIGNGGFTANDVEIDRQMEGVRLGGDNHGGGGATITNSYVLLDTSTVNNPVVDSNGDGVVNDKDSCLGHPDGVQAFGALGDFLIQHNTFDMQRYGDGRCNNADLFLTQSSPDNHYRVIDNAALGGGYSVRLQEGHFVATGNRIENHSFGPLLCQHDGDRPAPVIDSQSDNQAVTFDADYNPTFVRAVSC